MKIREDKIKRDIKNDVIAEIVLLILKGFSPGFFKIKIPGFNLIFFFIFFFIRIARLIWKQ